MRRIGLLLLMALAGCAGPPAGTNATTEKAPPPAPPVPPAGPDATAYRTAIEANEAPFREPSHLTPYLGEDARMDGVTVRPLEVIEDSRCPVDATCVWAGRVRIRVRVSVGNASAEAEMEIDRPMAIVVRDGRLELKAPQANQGWQQLTLVAVAPLNRARPPAGADPNARKRFAFSLMD